MTTAGGSGGLETDTKEEYFGRSTNTTISTEIEKESAPGATETPKEMDQNLKAGGIGCWAVFPRVGATKADYDPVFKVR